jgi:hypothetical protein
MAHHPPHFYRILGTPIGHAPAGSNNKSVSVRLVHRLSRMNDAADDRYGIDVEQPAN